MNDFLETIRQTIARHRMLRRGDHLLIGVSGGADSLALMTALVALREPFRLRLRVAYVNHQLRPQAVVREIALVKKIGRLWGVPVHILRKKIQKETGESLESAARRGRYEALTVLARRLDCGIIALGHTADDQAETVLMWLLRGAGTTGLAGIPPVRPIKEGRIRRSIKIIRPLIRSSRGDVESYLKAHRIRPLMDRSNLSGRFLRNRIRHRLIPMLEKEFNPQLRKHLAATAEVLREDLDWMRNQIQRTTRQVARVRARSIRLDRRQLRAVPTALRRGVLRSAVEKLQGDCRGFNVGHWTALEEMLLNGVSKGMDLPHGLRATAADRKWLLLSL